MLVRTALKRCSQVLLGPLPYNSTCLPALVMRSHVEAARWPAIGRLCSTAATPTGTGATSKVPAPSKPKNDNLGVRLMQFFDDKENWGQTVIRVGRAWKVDELRIKSNSDLHKLWFVLLKERNMLLTMQRAYQDDLEHFPNEERIDKVEESMENIEMVVRERNRAFYQLETGDSGERERYFRPGPLGFFVGYSDREHVLPFRLNTSYRKQLRFRFHTSRGKEVRVFIAKYIEKLSKLDRHLRFVQMRRCANMLRRFPNASDEAISEKYPLVSSSLVKRWRMVLGHHHNDQFNV